MAKDRPSVSRRGVLAGSLAAPVLTTTSPDLVGLHCADALSDPLIAKAKAWITQREHVDALTLEWGRLETQLRGKTRKLGVEMEEARGERFPEAQAMRVLDDKIEASYRDLADLAEAAGSMQAVSVAGVLAKLELGLRVQGKYSWQDHAMALLEGGVAQLRDLTTQDGQLSAQA